MKKEKGEAQKFFMSLQGAIDKYHKDVKKFMRK